MKLDLIAFALALGIVFALFTFVIAMVATLTGTALYFMSLVGELALGSSPTFLGACIAAGWMFAYGLIAGGLIAVIYNNIASG